MDAMTKSPITVGPDISIQECAQVMSEHNIGSLVIMQDKRLTGVITEWDIVRKVVASAKDPSETKVSSIMCTSVHSIEPDVDLFQAISMMADLEIRHLPVVHGGEFIGFLTSKDVLKIEPTLFDILIQSVTLREEGDKPIFGEVIEEIQDFGIGDDDQD